MPNFKSAAKRKRELAKLDKRQAKDQKRALRRAERSGTDVSTPAIAVSVVSAVAPAANDRLARGTPPVRKPLTLAEAVERWRNTKIAKPKGR